MVHVVRPRTPSNEVMRWVGRRPGSGIDLRTSWRLHHKHWYLSAKDDGLRDATHDQFANGAAASSPNDQQLDIGVGDEIEHRLGDIDTGCHVQRPLDIGELGLAQHLRYLGAKVYLLLFEHVDVDALGHMDDGHGGLSQTRLLCGLLKDQTRGSGYLVRDGDAHFILSSMLVVSGEPLMASLTKSFWAGLLEWFPYRGPQADAVEAPPTVGGAS